MSGEQPLPPHAMLAFGGGFAGCDDALALTADLSFGGAGGAASAGAGVSAGNGVGAAGAAAAGGSREAPLDSAFAQPLVPAPRTANAAMNVSTVSEGLRITSA